MRVWDIPVNKLCNKHLVAQHHEIHCIYGILTSNLRGFRNHPEVKRWTNRIGALYKMHESTVDEMIARGMNHQSLLLKPKLILTDNPLPWQPISEQIELLKVKGCECNV